MNLLNYAQASALLGRAEQTLRIDVMHHRIPFVKIGHQVRFIREDLEAWVRSKSVDAEG